MKRLFLFFILFVTAISCQSQSKQIINQQLYWMRYYNQFTLSKKWSWHNEFEERRFFVNNRHHHFIAHSRLYYKISKSSDIGFGVAYSLQDPQDPRATTILTVPELRAVQEFNYTNAATNRFSLSQRLRLDERFIHKNDGVTLTEGYDFNYRIRYRLQANLILNKDLKQKHTILKLSDELMINAGERIVYNRFDQNRIYAGIETPINKNFSAELGYMYWFQQKSTGYQYYDRDIFRLTLYHKSARKHS
jgi:hypothetical protein